MKLSVGLLTGLEHQTLSAFLNHSNCTLKTYTKFEAFLADSNSIKFDLLFVGDRFLKTESDYKGLREFVSRDGNNTKIVFVAAKAPIFKVPNIGIVSSEDYNTVKEILNFTKEKNQNDSPKPILLEPARPQPDQDDVEVVEVIEEEVMDSNFEKMTESFLKIKKAESIDEVFVSLTSSLENVLEKGRKGVVFKYLPTYCSLVAISGFHFQNKKVNGIGLNFSNSQEFNARDHLSQLKYIPAFQKIIKKVFGHENVRQRLLEADGEVKGVLLFEEPPSGSFDSNLLSLCDFSEVRLQAVIYKQKYIRHKTKDELTDCIQREGFFDQLQNEVMRSKRVLLPVTTMLIEIDGFYGIKAKFNGERVKILLKSFSKLLKKNVRHNDLVGRVGESKFAILFPHMSTEDGLIKAKKLSKLIGDTQFFSDMKTRLQCSTSIIIGTYPTQTGSADDLMSRLETAMTYKETVGTVSAIKPKPGFKKDFEERALPDSAMNRKKTESL